MILGKTLYYALTGSVSTSVAHAVPGLIGFVELELCIFQTVAIMEVCQNDPTPNFSCVFTGHSRTRFHAHAIQAFPTSHLQG